MFWSGAGISRDAPTNGPLGRSLTDRALDNYMSAGTRSEIAALYESLEVADAHARPRLETVLDALTDVYGLPGLADVLGDLADASPNAHHGFLARHVAAGGCHITANFDTCIERAGGFGSRLSHRVVHIHGAMTADGDLASLGARLQVIENGFPNELKDRLDQILCSHGTRALVFIGYSGSDFFDASPYLLERAVALSGKSVYWHVYRAGPLSWGIDSESLDNTALRDLIGRLAEEGVRVQLVSGKLDDFLAHISASWVLPEGRQLTKSPTVDWIPRLERSEELRRAASTALYSRMGYRRGVIDAYVRSLPTSGREWDRLADAYWGAGRYGDAAKAWSHAFAGHDSYNQARLAERRGAIMWIRGEYLRAERHLWRAVKRWGTPDSPAGPEAAAALLETYARLVEHMRRVPDARWFVRGRRAAEIESRLGLVSNKLGGVAGVALRARLENVQQALRGQPDRNLAAHVAGFSESEALHSWLNYEHASLRARAVVGRPPGQLDFQRQASRQRAIGATADVARTYLLPGAADYFSPLTVGREFRQVEMTTWHRLRLVGGYAAIWGTHYVRKWARSRMARISTRDSGG